jgi:hypothetical protein
VAAKGSKPAKAWEVLQNGTVVCSDRMGLTKQQALNKIENENRISPGSSWSIRQASSKPQYRLCDACGQPIQPGRHMPGEYRHAQGCPRDRSKYRYRRVPPIPAEAGVQDGRVTSRKEGLR